jgi:hypothetical protein
MSGRGRNAAPVVVREYRHSRNECDRALELLLKKPVGNMVAQPTLEPDSCNDAAIVRHTEGGETYRATTRKTIRDHIANSTRVRLSEDS